jgi:curli biogenesis system outer membrane secretion channel CsgG
VVEVGEGAEYLNPDAALQLATMSNADVVITGRVVRYETNRSSRPNVPLVLGFPQTAAILETDIRVVDRTEQGEVLSTRVGGSGSRNRGVRMFPTPGDDRTSYLSVI